jgi:hypothetical protein
MRLLLVLLVLVCVSGSDVEAQCDDYSNYIHLIADFRVEEGTYGVEIFENYAFITSMEEGIIVVDLTDPNTPEIVDTFELDEGIAEGISISGDIAYVSTTRRPLYTLDISDPLNTEILGYIDEYGSVEDFAYQDGFIYCAKGLDDFRVIDVSVPESPIEVGATGIIDSVNEVEVNGNEAYALSHSANRFTLTSLDVSDPTHPLILDQIFLPEQGLNLSVNGDYVYVTYFDWYMWIVDASDPADLNIVTSLRMPGQVYGLEFVDDLIYMTCGYAGLVVYDNSEPTQPALIGIADTPYWALDYEQFGTYGIGTDWYGGIWVVDVSNPTSLQPVGHQYTSETVYAIAEYGNYAVLANGEYGVVIVDKSDPASPEIASSFDTPGIAQGLAILGDRLFIADGESGFLIVDISDPTSPIDVGSITTNSEALDLIVRETTAYIAAGDSGVVIVDFSTPEAPFIVNTIQTFDSAKDIAVSNNHLFVADYWEGLTIIDITDPENPILIPAFDTPGLTLGIAINEPYAYVTEKAGTHSSVGLYIADVSDPTNVVVVGTAHTFGYPQEIRFDGQYAYIAASTSGYHVVDILDPFSPQIVGRVDFLRSSIRDLFVSDGLVYLANTTSGTLEQPGLYVVPTHCDLTMSAPDFIEYSDQISVATFPNPSRGKTSLNFRTTHEGPVKAIVCDVSGRKIKTISERIFAPGEHKLLWDGFDGKGRPVPSGVYHLIVQHPNGESSARFTMIR